MFDAGFAAAVSFDVATEKLVEKRRPAAGFVMPATVIVAACELASAHDPVSVTVTVEPDREPVVGQVPVKPEAKLTVGDAGIVKLFGNVIDTVSLDPPKRAPDDDEVNPTVQVVFDAFADKLDPLKVTLEGLVAAAVTVTVPDADAVGVVSCVVKTVKPDCA
jgi:hypothetical protein